MFSSDLLFFDIGGGEIILIMLVALLLFGGEKLPELARGLGKGIRDFKDASEGVKREIANQIDSYESKKTETPAAPVETPEVVHEAPAVADHTPVVESHVANTIPAGESHVATDSIDIDHVAEKHGDTNHHPTTETAKEEHKA
ncbi:MAG: Sec-independent protein translocase subunit TatA/TatB [Mucilaginibacter sp.]